MLFHVQIHILPLKNHTCGQLWVEASGLTCLSVVDIACSHYFLRWLCTFGQHGVSTANTWTSCPQSLPINTRRFLSPEWEANVGQELPLWFALHNSSMSLLWICSKVFLVLAVLLVFVFSLWHLDDWTYRLCQFNQVEAEEAVDISERYGVSAVPLFLIFQVSGEALLVQLWRQASRGCTMYCAAISAPSHVEWQAIFLIQCPYTYWVGLECCWTRISVFLVHGQYNSPPKMQTLVHFNCCITLLSWNAALTTEWSWRVASKKQWWCGCVWKAKNLKALRGM